MNITDSLSSLGRNPSVFDRISPARWDVLSLFDSRLHKGQLVVLERGEGVRC